ncbi:MAG: hypothetical protein EF813_10710 [Methanosarcinales archaeon]|nr:MAG: hypothetical protein EF813_10710 [Methanosarcinales archaeon]
MSRYIPDIRAIRSFVILYADFITNFTNVPNATNFNRLFSGKPLDAVKNTPLVYSTSRCSDQKPMNFFGILGTGVLENHRGHVGHIGGER